jgi:hypothetical protein
MSSSHTIRLHAAWKRIDDSGQAAPGDGRELLVSLPDTSILSVNASAVVYRRAFHRPTGLAAGDSICLQSGLLPIAASIRFNGNQIDIPTQASIEIGASLLSHNELAVTIVADQFHAAARASAVLEIRSAD